MDNSWKNLPIKELEELKLDIEKDILRQTHFKDAPDWIPTHIRDLTISGRIKVITRDPTDYICTSGSCDEEVEMELELYDGEGNDPVQIDINFELKRSHEDGSRKTVIHFWTYDDEGVGHAYSLIIREREREWGEPTLTIENAGRFFQKVLPVLGLKIEDSWNLMAFLLGGCLWNREPPSWKDIITREMVR